MQPDPIKNDYPSIHDEVVDASHLYHDLPDRREAFEKAILERKRIGLEAYGTLLQPMNGRNAEKDLQDELLDALVYLKQMVRESDLDPKRTVRQTMQIESKFYRLLDLVIRDFF